MTDVNIEAGISDGMAQRATVSITSIKIPPNPTDAGMTYLLSLPNIMRAMWGMSSPTHPISPHMETTEAVIIAAEVITAILITLTGIPRERASSSLNVIALSFQRRRYIVKVPAIMRGEPMAKVFFVAEERLPISQNVTAGRTS